MYDRHSNISTKIVQKAKTQNIYIKLHFQRLQLVSPVHGGRIAAREEAWQAQAAFYRNGGAFYLCSLLAPTTFLQCGYIR